MPQVFFTHILTATKRRRDAPQAPVQDSSSATGWLDSTLQLRQIPSEPTNRGSDGVEQDKQAPFESKNSSVGQPQEDTSTLSYEFVDGFHAKLAELQHTSPFKLPVFSGQEQT